MSTALMPVAVVIPWPRRSLIAGGLSGGRPTAGPRPEQGEADAREPDVDNRVYGKAWQRGCHRKGVPKGEDEHEVIHRMNGHHQPNGVHAQPRRRKQDAD